MTQSEDFKDELRKALNHCRVNYGSNGISDEYEEEVAAQLVVLHEAGIRAEHYFSHWEDTLKEKQVCVCGKVGTPSQIEGHVKWKLAELTNLHEASLGAVGGNHGDSK